MTSVAVGASPAAVQPITPQSAALARLQRALNQHDIAACTACFTTDYQARFPAHPDRGLQTPAGAEQTWSRIFGSVPDLRAELISEVIAGETVWAEWAWNGTRVDGVPFAMRGVTISGVAQESLRWSRMYMEPVEIDGAGREADVSKILGEGAKQ